MGMTPAQAAKELGISRQAVHKAIEEKRLKAREVAPGWYLIDEKSIAAYKPKDYPKSK